MLVMSQVRTPAGEPAATAAWHALTVDAALAGLASAPDGLPAGEASTRLASVGLNSLPAPAGPSALAVLGNQLRSIVVLLLVAATALSLIVGDRLEAAAVAAVLVINAALGFTTEWRARRAMAALLELEAARALVLRDGQLLVVPAATLVPGDVVRLDAGNKVPADVRLIDTNGLAIDEAPLTGESLAVEKSVEPLPRETLMADRVNSAYMGTTITAGFGLGVVTATGAATELGRIGTLVGRISEEPTPLERRLDALGRRLAWLTIAVAALVAAAGVLNGMPWGAVLQTGIALAVAAMPEALPAVATIALAVGMYRMARRNALVRRLPSVESLGSATVVCTDKTRTLTTGEMTVVTVATASTEFASRDGRWGDEPAAILTMGALASQTQAGAAGDHSGLGNPVDRALLAALPTSGIGIDALVRERPRVGMVPFSSARKLMASFHDNRGTLWAYVKGGPAVVLDRCTDLRDQPGQGARPLLAADRARLRETNERLARGGLRILAVASGPVGRASGDALTGLTFEGFIGIADPVAGGVGATIELLRGAGLRTVMITGDQRGTAEAVGQAVGLLAHAARVVDGRELAAMSAAERAARIPEVDVFSRVSPEDKLIIVTALQERGEVVAMLGDGINDAAALRKADVGVAMGRRGTDTAKQAAAIVLQDDRFETIAAAVEEGRIVFDNIRKFVFYLFSCNVAEVLVLLIAGIAGWPSPLAPLQLLWLNLVTDTFPALALALEPGDASVMRRPPRDPNEAILSRAFVTTILWHAVTITIATLIAFRWSAGLRPEAGSTIAFMTLAFAQILHLGNARSDEHVLEPRRAFANRFALAAVFVSIGLQLSTTAAGLSGILGVIPLGRMEWTLVAVCAGVPAALGQLVKLVLGSGSRARGFFPGAVN
jgi:Ca2+-transporting ATPase